MIYSQCFQNRLGFPHVGWQREWIALKLLVLEIFTVMCMRSLNVACNSLAMIGLKKGSILWGMRLRFFREIIWFPGQTRHGVVLAEVGATATDGKFFKDGVKTLGTRKFQDSHWRVNLDDGTYSWWLAPLLDETFAETFSSTGSGFDWLSKVW